MILSLIFIVQLYIIIEYLGGQQRYMIIITLRFRKSDFNLNRPTHGSGRTVLVLHFVVSVKMTLVFRV